jgi:hypothetical protein
MPATIVEERAPWPRVVIECGRLRVHGLDLDGALMLRRLA